MIGRSPLMAKLLDTVAQVAATEAIVLITGESGTGKEMIAMPFIITVRVRCAIHKNQLRGAD